MFGFQRPPLEARPAHSADREALLRLLRTARFLHTHLDWRQPLDWLEAQPFLLAARGDQLAGTLACPPDLADTAWIRLFACEGREKSPAIWNRLWPAAAEGLRAQGVAQAAGLSLEGWMEPLYRQAGFEHTHAVVVLALRLNEAAPAPARPADVSIRRARPEEGPLLADIDRSAFSAPWQISVAVMRAAVEQAEYLTVAEAGGQVIGYQLTTPNPDGGHLARLAVRPERQGRGIGAALVADLIAYYQRRGARQLTVNTQDNNRASLQVYQRAGFHLNGLTYPVYQAQL